MNKVIALPIEGKRPDGAISLEERDDDGLMLMARAGVPQAFEILVRRHQRMVLVTAMKYLGNLQSAEDVAQSSFVDLFRSLASYRPEGKLRAFLATIVINNCRMAKRHERSEAGMRQDLIGLESPPAVSTNHERELQSREAQRLLDAALLTLSPKLREVLVLRYAAGLSHQQIGEALGLRLGTVKSRLFAAVAKLGQALETLEL